MLLKIIMNVVIIQDKVNLDHVDNTSLIEQAFSFKSDKPPKFNLVSDDNLPF